jgi:hypothetical protein
VSKCAPFSNLLSSDIFHPLGKINVTPSFACFFSGESLQDMAISRMNVSSALIFTAFSFMHGFV